jgi:hypothetical protein
MPIHPDLLHALEDIDAATNDVAQEADDLRAQTRMHAQADKLRGIAADPAIPVPPEPEVDPVG